MKWTKFSIEKKKYKKWLTIFFFYKIARNEVNLSNLSRVCRKMNQLTFVTKRKLDLGSHKEKIKKENLLPLLQKCTKLKTLNLNKCKFLPQLPCLVGLITNLEKLNISDTFLKNIDSLSRLKKLKSLTANNLSKINVFFFLIFFF